MYRLADLSAGSPVTLIGESGAPSWARRGAAIREVWHDYVGALPAPVPVSVRVSDETVADGVRRQHLTYSAPAGVEVPAFLLSPDPLPRTQLPAVLALHPTDAAGKDVPAGRVGTPDLHYGLELAQRGYVVLAPDAVTMGERVDIGEEPISTFAFDRSHPGFTAVGRMIVDHRQGIDVLTSLPHVNQRAIGAIGHSLGGYNAFFLAGADGRVAATVCNCGFGMFADDPWPDRWCKDQHSDFDHLPSLKGDLQQGLVPWEWHEILALVAPRPLLVAWDRIDEIFPNASAIGGGLTEVARLYRVLGHEKDFVTNCGSTGHAFPSMTRGRAFAFLDQALASA